MENISIQFKGIQRQLPYQNNPDGVLDELINLRHYKGRLEPVGLKPIDWVIPSNNEYVAGWVHEMDSETNWIGQDSSNQLVLIKSGESVSETFIKSYPGSVKVEFLTRFMIVVYDGGMDRFVWKDGVYIPVSITLRPRFNVYKSDENFEYGEYNTLSVTNEALITSLRGMYYNQLNGKSDDGYFSGGLFIRAAFKLFDGSYVMHTIPQFVAVNNFNITIEQYNKNAPADFRIGFTSAKLNTLIPTELYSSLPANITDIISDVVIFSTKAETIIKWDETLDDEILHYMLLYSDSGLPFPYSFTLNSIISTVNPDFKELHDSASWYKIAEYPLSKILEGDVNEEIDLTDFYQDYATREVLQVDNFSHHELAANVTYNYNSRLVIADTSLKFGDYKYFPLQPILDGTEFPNIMPAGYTADGTRYFRMLVTIETDSATIKKLGQQFELLTYIKPAVVNDRFVPLAVGELGYPDARATMIEILYSENQADWFKVGSYNLKKSKYDNFAYYILDNFSTAATAHVAGTGNYPVVIHTLTAPVAVQLASYPETTYLDRNRVQISELNNPFFFPAENSYQVGTGTITGIAANTEPISTGQFGEYPLQVFTTKGIWAMLQGQGSILYSNIVPVSGEVANPSSIVAISQGVVYSTSKGLFLLQGQQTTELTTLATGLPNADFQANVNYQYYISNNKLVQLSDSLTNVDILEYLTGANIGYDHVNKELVVSNPNYSYSYIYGFESGMWFKIDFSVKLLVNYYPKLFAFKELILSGSVAETRIINLSDEIKTDIWKDVLLTSQPMMFGSESFKVIRRVILRTIHETQEGVFNSGFYLFGSSDLINWQRVTGRNHISGRKRDILLQRSGSKFKYFIFVFAAKLKVVGSYIAELQISFDYKANNKLR